MKINHPVSDREVDFGQNANLLSTTDLKGAITYVNPDFIDISGFTEEELIGKNHNIVRHPDMPPAAFESLWSSVKSGKPWMGMVKNRCKNGDHYWVDAYVMPIKENGGNSIEYQSVRFKPERNWIERAETAYKKLMEGKTPQRSIMAKLGLGNRLAIGNILALLPAVIFTQLEYLSNFSYIGFVITAIAMLMVNYALTKPIHSLVKQAREVFDNHLMTKIYTGRDDEFGNIQLAMKMQKSQIDAIIGRLSDTTNSLSESASVTQQTAEQASQGVAIQQQEVDQVATAMTEMAATVQEIAKNATLAAESTVMGSKKTEEGSEVVKLNIEAINKLENEIKKTSEVIQKLSEYSTDIVKVLDVIKGIAEQTNLLALNAAIEAARAGENGRGFAVVADEVRTLAARTTESAREIEEMIDLLQGSSDEAVGVMKQSRDMADESVHQAAKAGEALELINQAIKDITDMNHQIATASEEQGTVASEINQNIVNISQVAETTSTGTSRSFEATKEMSETIERLERLIHQFKR